MQRGEFMKLKKILCIILTLVITIHLFPTTTFAISTPTYITDICIAYSKSNSTAKDLVTDNGYTLINYDLNENAGGRYIYMGYKESFDYTRAITGIIFRKGENPPDTIEYMGVEFQLVGGAYEQNGTGDGVVDLNVGAGGEYIYTYITRDLNYGYPLIKLGTKNYATDASSQDIVTCINTFGEAQNLNEDAGGDDIYLYHVTFENINNWNDSSTSNIVYIEYRYLTKSGSSTSYNVQIPVKHHMQQASRIPDLSKSAIIDGTTVKHTGWRSDISDYSSETDNPYGTYMSGTSISDYLTYLATYEGEITLTYNANGGTNAPKSETHIVRVLPRHFSSGVYLENESRNFSVPNTKPYKSRSCFAGWSTDKNATTSSYEIGKSYTFKSDTTLYAVWNEHSDENKDYICDKCGETILDKFEIAEYDSSEETAKILIPKEGTYTVILADYEDKKLANIQTTVIITTSESVAYVPITEGFKLENGDKIMIWENLDSLVPLCDAYTIN